MHEKKIFSILKGNHMWNSTWMIRDGSKGSLPKPSNLPKEDEENKDMVMKLMKLYKQTNKQTKN